MDVAVSIDGVEVASRLDGRSVPVDPGEHRVRFVWGRAQQERRVLFVVGEKNRKIEARFAEPEPPAPRPAAARPSPWPWALGAVGVVGLAGFAGFGLSGRADLRDLDGCAPRCDPERVDDAKGKYVIADLSLAVGIVGLGLATYLFLTGDGVRHAAP
jgi:hypothetical protein